jgi:hypothetical protein
MKKILMNLIVKTIILICLIYNFQNGFSQNDSIGKSCIFNQKLCDELIEMGKLDQIAAYIPQGLYKKWSSKQWDTFKDSVFRMHKKRLEEIFNEYGYPGYNLVGKKGELNFWLITQHSDFDTSFQIQVLRKMKIEVENNNASPTNYGLLTDRVLINTGKNQLYGTQVTYNSQGQAYPKNLADSINVNKRRVEKGFEPIEEYLNAMTDLYFRMNRDYLKEKGILEPQFYKTKNDTNKKNNNSLLP